MKKLRFILLWCSMLASGYTFGQRIKSAEYFFDSDPGVNKGKAITFTNNLDSINRNDSLSTSGLGVGFHSLFLRVKDSLGNWSLYEGRNFLIDNNTSTPGTFKNPKAEYFFDFDPGIGKAKPLSITITADSIVDSDSIPTTGLKSGFHGLFLRVQNSLGIWSLYEGRNFLIDSVSKVAVTFKNPKAEYFFDYDPGIGKAKPLSITVTADSIAVSDSFPTTGLKSGFHGLFLRVQNSAGIWSLYEGRNFLIDSVSKLAATFKNPKAEYFFDYDPGIGKGKPISITSNADSIVVSDSFPATGLKSGFHGLFLRVQNSLGIWSLYEGRNFFIDTGISIKPVTNNIVSAEYFFDTDPGFGKATNIPTSFTPADSVKVSSLISVSGLSSGNHNLILRVKDKTNNWSLLASAKFFVCSTALPAPAISGKTNYCSGDSIKLSAASISGASNYFWTGPNGFTSTTLNIYVANVDSAKNSGIYSFYATRSGGTACDTSPIASDTIVINQRPVANTGLPQTICFGGNSIIGSKSIANLTYSWISSPGSFSSTVANPTVSPTVTTTYYLAVTNKSGCIAGSSTIITVNALPKNNAGANSSVCSGSSVLIGASAVGGSKYSWVSNPSGFSSTLANPFVSPTTGTTYVLTETNASGCSSTNSVIVGVNPLPSPVAGTSQAICNSGSVSIGSSSSVTGDTYNWTSNPSGFSSTSPGPTVSPTITTTFTITETIAATGCSKSDSTLIYVNPQPSANAGSPQTICSGDSIKIGGTTVIGDSYNWVSSPSGFTSIISNPYIKPTSTTTYTLTETVGTCSKTNSVIVTVNPIPSPIVGSPQTICSGSTTSIGGASVSGYSYNWKSNPSGFTSNVSNPTINPNITTVYDLTETINATGCHKTDSVTITVNPLPLVGVGVPATICLGSSVAIGSISISGNSYSWASNPGGFSAATANPTVSPTLTTVYRLTETIIATGCQKTDSVKVTVNPLPIPNAGGNHSICLGSSIAIGSNGTGGQTFSWTSKPSGFLSTSSAPTVSPTVNTTYYVVETITSTGCAKSDSAAIVVLPLPNPKWFVNYFGSITYLHAKDSSLTNAAYNWDFGDGIKDSVSGHLAKHLYPQNKSYDINLKLIGTNGCVNSFDSLVNITVSGIDPLDQGINKLLIFPNPFESSLIIQFELNRTSDMHIAVYDLAGREVVHFAMVNQAPGQKNIEIDADKYIFNPGVYLLKLITSQGIITRQIVKL